MERVVVIGASLAGLRAAQAVRSAGHEGSLVVVGDERRLPYTRPPLSKQLLAGEQTADNCAFPGTDAVACEWRLGAPATALHRERKSVELAGGEAIPYDRLIVATGSRARAWPGDGATLRGVHTLRDLDNAVALRAALTSGPRRLAIVGAGFVGCEVAATARKAGVDVTLIDVATQPMVPLGPELGARCAELHERHGVDLRLGAGVAGLRGTDAVKGVDLAEGTTVDADVVLVALGALPNTEWLRDSGLALDERGGIVCDATLTAVGDADVLAAGDVVSWPHPLADGAAVRVEHWTTAAEHGGVAGRNAVVDDPAERAAHVHPPYFWSDQYDIKIQAVGFPALGSLEIVEEDGPRLVAEARDAAGRLVGAITFNNAKRLAAYRRQLATEAVAA
jgi:NADPH-dependent 2,4-dienoyl-CoA reductase/sulfur reductase-like enzyme